MRIIFFGSFQANSVKVLRGLLAETKLEVLGVVTTPAKPVGRKKILKPNEVETFALGQNLPVFTPAKLTSKELAKLPSAEIFLVAGYGQILPETWLQAPTTACLNVHFSLLPKYRGANPAEWAILKGELKTGITLITMNQGIDEGQILAQKSLALAAKETRITLYEKLYSLAAEATPSWLLKINSLLPGEQQPPKSPTPMAKKFTRDQGFIAWELLNKLITPGEHTPPGYAKHQANFSEFLQLALESIKENQVNLAEFVERAIRALAGFPGVWTILPTKKGNKRLKILTSKLVQNKLVLQKIQLEGQQPANWNQIKNLVPNP